MPLKMMTSGNTGILSMTKKILGAIRELSLEKKKSKQWEWCNGKILISKLLRVAVVSDHLKGCIFHVQKCYMIVYSISNMI